jgi:cell division protein FtsL
LERFVPGIELKVVVDVLVMLKQMDKKVVATSILIAVVFVAAVAGTIVYFNGVLSNGNSKIASLNGQIADLNRKVSDLKAKAANISDQKKDLLSPEIVTSLGVSEVPYDSPHNYPTPLLYNHILIMGSVANTGVTTAYNVGLHVIAYQEDGKIQVNMTVPLINWANETSNENTDFAPVFGTDASTQIYGNESLQLGNLYSGQNITVILGIFHHGTATKWTITPVWTSNPTPTTLIPPTLTLKPLPSVATVITSVTFNNTTYDFGSGAQSEKIPDFLMSVGQNASLIVKIEGHETSNQSVTPAIQGCIVSFSDNNGTVLFDPGFNELGLLPPINGLTLSWNLEASKPGVANTVITIKPESASYTFQNATLSFKVTITK